MRRLSPAFAFPDAVLPVVCLPGIKLTKKVLYDTVSLHGTFVLIRSDQTRSNQIRPNQIRSYHIRLGQKAGKEIK